MTVALIPLMLCSSVRLNKSKEYFTVRLVYE